MKDINEYTAEVLRRVDEKKRERRNSIIRTAAFCVPAVFAAAVLALVLPRISGSAGPDSAAGVIEATPPPADAALPSPITEGAIDGALGLEVDEIEVGSPLYYDKFIISSPDLIGEICRIIFEAEGSADPADCIDSALPRYRIILHCADGTKPEYTLGEGIIRNEESGAVFTLSSSNEAELLRLLGINEQ